MPDFDKINIDDVSYLVKDTTARNQIAAEILDRENADKALQNKISAEQTARQNADDNINARLDSLSKQDLASAKIITPQMYGAKGDGVTDDSDAFIAAIEAAYNQGCTLYIPATGNLDTPAGYNGYILSKTLNITKPMSIMADPLSVLNWAHMTNEPTVSGTDPTTGATLYSTGIGINIDYGNYRNHKGNYRFGVLQGCMTYKYPGASLPSGHYGYAVRIANGDLVNFYAKYVSYWKRGIMVESANDFTGNETLEWDVMDDCQEGLVFVSQGSSIIEGVTVRFNTIGLCRYGIAFYRQNTGSVSPVIHGVTIEGAEIWTEYTGGTCIYSQTLQGDVQNLKISVGEAYNVCNPETSKEGISVASYGPIISGSGNNCFKAKNAVLDVGVVVSDDSQLSSRGAVGLDGQIMFRNRVEQYANDYSTAYSAITSAGGSFNNGKIPVANRMFVVMNLTADLAAGSSLSFYVKMQNAPSGGNASPFIMPCAAYPAIMSITNVSDYTNYQVYKIDIMATAAMGPGWQLYAIVGF